MPMTVDGTWVLTQMAVKGDLMLVSDIELVVLLPSFLCSAKIHPWSRDMDMPRSREQRGK